MNEQKVLENCSVIDVYYILMKSFREKILCTFSLEDSLHWFVLHLFDGSILTRLAADCARPSRHLALAFPVQTSV